MKTLEYITYLVDKEGAEKIVTVENDAVEFSLYGDRWIVFIDSLANRVDVSVNVFSENQRIEEDLAIEDVREAVNEMTSNSEAAFFVQCDDDVYCRLSFNYNSLEDLKNKLFETINEIEILEEAFLNVVCGTRIDAHLDFVFIAEQIRNARYNHLKETLDCNILYVHGFRSSGNGGTAKRLRALLPHCKVVSPDLPVMADEAVELLKSIIEDEKIDVVVGTSIGGMLAQKLRGVPKILVNPSFFVSETFKRNMGTVTYFNDREDGETEFEITPEVVETYAKLERGQFKRISAKENGMTVGVFGHHDDTVNCKEDFKSHYENIGCFDGGHRLDEDALKDVIIPLIARLYSNSKS